LMYFVAPDMTLVCIDIAASDSKPEILYQKNLKSIFADIDDYTCVPVLASPLLVEDSIVVSIQVDIAGKRDRPHRPNLVTKIAGFSKDNGDERWQFTTSTNGSRFQYTSPVIFSKASGYSLVGTDPNGRCFGFDREALLAQPISPSWSIDLAAQANDHSAFENTIGVVATPIIADDHLFVVSGNEPSNVAEHGMGACFQSTDKPTAIWTVGIAEQFSGAVASPLKYRSNFVLVTGFGELLLVDMFAGTIKNRIDLGAEVYATPVLVNDELVVIDGGGRLLSITLNEDIRISRELNLDAFASCSPVLAGSRIIAAVRGEVISVRHFQTRDKE